jgi:MYXO-CTERM domain-containing protein
VNAFARLVIAGCTALWSTESSAASELVAPRGPTGIVGGEIDDADEYPSVVAIQAHLQRCTGLMVSPTVVLTAAHCVADLRYGRVAIVYPGVDVSPEEERIQGIRWGMHPDYCPSCDRNQYDYGFIELFSGYEPAGGFVEPLDTRVQWDAIMQPGTAITAVGYGEQSEGVNDPWARRTVGLEVSKIIRGGVEFEAGGQGTGTCEGDSGSPAFVRLEDGSLRWGGIDSRGFGCGAKGIYGASFASLCWLRDDADVDLLPAGCESCDCVEVAEGCGCRTSAPPSSGLVGLVSLLLGLRRRRRCPGIHALTGR